MADYASEQTLQDLLQVAQAMNVNLIKISSTLVKTQQSEDKKTPGASGAKSDVVDTMTKQFGRFLPVAKAVSGAFELLAPIVSTVAKIFSGLFGMIGSLLSGIGNVVGILKDFALSAASGNMKMSDLVGVMGDLAAQVPIVGGVLSSLAGLAKIVMQRQEENLEMYRKLTSVGSEMGTGLLALRTMIQNTGLSFDEYIGIIRENAQAFSTVGGTAQQGAEVFKKASIALLGQDSELRQQLFGLGFTARDVGETLATYIVTQGAMTKKDRENTTAIATGAAELGKQFAYLSEATGQQRELIEKDLKKQMEDIANRDFISSLQGAQKEQVNLMLATAKAQGGEKYEKYILNSLRTGIFTPLNDEGRKLVASTGGAIIKSAEASYKATFATYQDQETARIAITKRGNAAAALSIEGQRNFQNRLGITAKIQDGLNQSILDNGLREGKLRVDAAGGLQKWTDQQNAALAHGKESAKYDAERLANDQQNLRRFGQTIDNLISTLSGPFIGPIMSLSESFLGISQKFADLIKPKLEWFGTWFTGWTDKFTKINSWDEFKTTMKAFWEDTKKEFGPAIREMWNSIKPLLADVFSGIMDFIITALRKNSVIARFLFGKTDTEKSEEKQNDIDKLKAQIAKDQQLLDRAKASGGAGRGRGSVGPDYYQRELDRHKAELAKLQGPDANQPGILREPAKNNGAEAPKVDQATNIRNWAYSMMIGATPDDASKVPASIKDDVLKIYNNPDANLKAQAESFKAAEAKKAADQKAAQEREAADKKSADAKAAAEKKEQKPADAPAASVQEPKQDPITALNTNIARLIAVNTRTAEATEKTATTLASNGNLFRK
jgi:hypothetical protein